MNNSYLPWKGGIRNTQKKEHQNIRKPWRTIGICPPLFQQELWRHEVPNWTPRRIASFGNTSAPNKWLCDPSCKSWLDLLQWDINGSVCHCLFGWKNTDRCFSIKHKKYLNMLQTRQKLSIIILLNISSRFKYTMSKQSFTILHPYTFFGSRNMFLTRQIQPS